MWNALVQSSIPSKSKSPARLDMKFGAKISDDGKEVVLTVEDFTKLIQYVNRLEEANAKLNAEIEAYNKEFT